MTHWELDDEEVAAILAGLRLIQQAMESGKAEDALPGDIYEIYSNGEEGGGLTPEQIDDLCVRVNSATDIEMTCPDIDEDEDEEDDDSHDMEDE